VAPFLVSFAPGLRAGGGGVRRSPRRGPRGCKPDRRAEGTPPRQLGRSAAGAALPDRPEVDESPAQARANRLRGSCSSSCIRARSAPSRVLPEGRRAAGQDTGEPVRPPGRTVGKRVGGNPSRVRISYPPQVRGPAPFAGAGPLRFRQALAGPTGEHGFALPSPALQAPRIQPPRVATPSGEM
jgi:hypothetical protein